ncbi:MAG TPA: HEPN domain-containing protein, partial [Chitinophagaceae bacterium]
LARGVYGQRQPGVQMVRIKLPYGKMTLAQWARIADVSDEFATGNLHLTTRQDIQVHFVSLDRTPELWAMLEQDHVTIREACGNTVRNVTASDQAGIDPDEPFDVTPYAHGVFEYFLRKPVCQEMGRKFKIAFSSSEKDTAFTFMHDLGGIPRVRNVDGKEQRGFRIVIGGGLGAQPFLAVPTHEFLEEDLLIPYIESVLRVFDRYGERTSRHKARLKFLIQKIGIDAFNELVLQEQKALTYQHYHINWESFVAPVAQPAVETAPVTISNPLQFELWKNTNVVPQKQEGFFAVYVRVLNGNVPTGTARRLIEKLRPVIADDVRITVNQGLQFRFVRPAHLEHVFAALEAEGLAAPGFGSVADVTSCPGTDTCNLGISNSTGIAAVLSGVIDDEFPEFISNNDISIKISGCMNSCGQHGMASIGFHGSSMKVKGQVLPALQVLVGGGVVGGGEGRIADKVLKVPSKRGPDVLRYLLNDYKANGNGEKYLDYTKRRGERYFYDLLKPLASTESLRDEDYIDWGQEERYSTAIGVGECAGVMIDLVATLILEAEEKLERGRENIDNGGFADGIYNAYTAYVHAAKALLLQQAVQCNTQAGILRDFDTHFTKTGLYTRSNSFKDTVLAMNEATPTREFAEEYLSSATSFVEFSRTLREQIIASENAVV